MCVGHEAFQVSVLSSKYMSVCVCTCLVAPACWRGRRFQFEPDSLEVVVAGKEEQQTENAFVGGRNR